MTATDELGESLKDRVNTQPELGWTSDQRWVWFWGALLAISLPMFIPYMIEMLSYEHYRYIPFVFLVVGYLVWTRSDRVLRAPSGWFAWSMVVVGLLFIVASLLVPSVWLAGLAFVILAATCLGSMRGTEDRNLLAAAVPLLMLIQLPVGLDQWLINQLQGVTTDLSSVAMDVIGVPHSIAGNTVQLVSRELFVAEACSGIQSVFTLAFIACVVVAINRRRLWLFPLYLLVSVFLAIAGNVLRVTTVAVAEHWFARDLSSGWQHDVLGYITLGIATLFLLSFDQLIVVLLHPANAGGDSAMESPLVRAWNYLVADWQFSNDDGVYGKTARKSVESATAKPGLLDRLVMNRTGWIASLVFLAVIGIGAAVQATRVEINPAPRQLVGSYILFDPKPELLQGEYQISVVSDHQVNRDGQEPRLGQNADLWDINVGQLPGQVVVSQTYRGWHELCVCYENMDWRQLSREVTTPPESETPVADPTTFITARFRNREGQFGYLLFSAVNEDGTIEEAPSSFVAFQSRLRGRLERQGVISQQNLVMFQMWLVTAEKIRPETLRQMQLDFLEMRSRIAESVVADAVGQSKTTSVANQKNVEG